MSVNRKKKKKKIIFFGDSITEFGEQPGGYIRIVRQSLNEELVDTDYELVNAGVSGNKVYDLYLRLEEDILAKGPTLVVLFIGINDVWHKFSKRTGTDITRFEAFYVAIINKLASAGIKIVICTPTVIGEHPAFAREEDEELNAFSHLIRNISTRYNVPLVDCRKAFIEYLVDNNDTNVAKGVLTNDEVHLNQQGNHLVATEMWKVLKPII